MNNQSKTWVILLILCSILFFGVGRSSSSSNSLDEYEQLVNEYKSQVEDMVKFTNSLADSAETLQTKIDTLSTNNNKLKQTVDTLTKKIFVISKKTDSLKSVADTISNIPVPVKEYIIVLEQENELLTESNIKKDSIIFNLTGLVELTTLQSNIHKTRADSLQNLIVQFPHDVPRPDKIFGFIPKPTRTQSLILGSIVTLTVQKVYHGK